MDPMHEYGLAMTRRHFFRQGALGLGTAALASLLAEAAAPKPAQKRDGGLPELPHFAPKAKRASYLFMNGGPAVTYICTGNQIPGRPSLGAWLSYGLGSETKDLPAFVVMTPSWSAKNDPQALYNRLWGAGFLPSRHQGVALRAQGDPVLFLSNPEGVSSHARRRMLDTLAK